MELRMTLECLRSIGIRICLLRGFSRAFELHEVLALMDGEIIQCSQASGLPCRHRQDRSPGRPGRLSQAVGQERSSSRKHYRLRGGL